MPFSISAAVGFIVLSDVAGEKAIGEIVNPAGFPSEAGYVMVHDGFPTAAQDDTGDFDRGGFDRRAAGRSVGCHGDTDCDHDRYVVHGYVIDVRGYAVLPGQAKTR